MKIKRYVSAMICVLMIISAAIPSGFAVNTQIEALQQADARWSDFVYGAGKNISNYGKSSCGLFSSINAVRALTDREFSINEIKAWGDYAGPLYYVLGHGSEHTIVKGLADKFGNTYYYRCTECYQFGNYISLKGDNYPKTESGMTTIWNKLTSELEKGRVCVTLVQDHFIAIIDYNKNTDKVFILDSAADEDIRKTHVSGDWKSKNELYYGSKDGSEMLKLRCCFNFLEAATGNYKINTSSDPLNMRASNTASSSTVGSVPKGEVVAVTQISNGFGKIVYKNTTGWISMRYTKFVSRDPVSEINSPSNSKGNYKVATSGSGLNLRASASTSGNILTTVPNGTPVTVYEVLNGFGKVSYKNTVGWLSMSYLAPVTAINSETTSSGMYKVTTSGGSLKLRASASASANVLTLVPNGTDVVVNQISNGFGKASYNGNTGWLSMNYLTYNFVATQLGRYKVRTNSGRLKMHESDSADSKTIALVPNGADLNVISTSNGFGKVTYNGNTGWVSLNYLSKSLVP
ncbi:MAG: SH3 domain-containing protein [Clostridiales bacterium]|nr:SH3 domain-containing protein [Clostridiales bacterium]